MWAKCWERVLWMMNKPIEVKIVGAPVACAEGVKELWRDVATWASRQLDTKFGNLVITRYFDLFDPDCPPLPADSQLPVVFVDEKQVSSGGKISIPLIRQEIEARIAVHIK
jgi:disulfide oxidoreductase YuzD